MPAKVPAREAIAALVAELRRDAAWEMGDSADALTALVDLLLSYRPEDLIDDAGDVGDEHWRARTAIEAGLVRLGSIAPPRLRPLLEHANREAARSAATVLGALSDLASLDTLLAWATRRDEEHQSERHVAISALGGFRDPRAVAVLLDALGEPAGTLNRGWTIRLAAGALGKIGDPRAVAPLVGLLGDADWFVRLGACEGLGVLGGEAARAALQRTRGDPDHRVSAAAAVALVTSRS
jgi:HEAT repeat protein